jgi:hypothetical protein
MKYYFIIASLLLSLPLVAQTKVVQKNAVKANDFGITYSLPRTTLAIHAEFTKVTCKAGPYYQYAEKYLNIKDVNTDDHVYYELGKVTIQNKGVPNPDKTYIVSFKQGTSAPYCMLTEDGLLCTINAPYEAAVDTSSNASAKDSSKSMANINKSSVLPEELLMAGSTTKQAEVAAKQIYHIRESRLNILTGDADNLPPDGKAMELVIQQLQAQEAALTELFTGTTTREQFSSDFTVVPDSDLNNDILFRFSKRLGIVAADDLGGTPVYLNLKATEKAPTLDPKEAEKKEKSLKGIIYNVPGKANVTITMDGKVLYAAEIQITQFGSQEGLAPVMFEDKKAPVKVYFYPETGALKQIIQ